MFINLYSKEIIGSIDKLDFPLLNIENVATRVDTGATNSSLHCTNIEKIDEELVSHLKQGNITDIGSVEKSILRLAIFEIFDGLDKAIVINEAIELSKKLASDGAPKFINGLLDKVKKA